MRKKTFRLLAMLALCMAVVCSFSVTAFAYAEDTEQDLPVTEATQPEETPKPDPEPEEVPETITPGEPIDDTGNAYTRDLLYDKATNKQFISIQTKNGSTFYVVIDYDAPINEEEEQYQTYFLNMVDEADLLALMDEEAVSALKTCTCSEKCVAGAIDNYGMIDGIINNGSKEDKSAERSSKSSIMDRLKAAKSEPQKDKPTPHKEPKKDREL